MCMPRSQNAVMERPAFSQLWQDYELPGSLTFGSKNPLPPGSAVIVHSALLHGRRAQPGGDPNQPRYFIDISCAHSSSPSGSASSPNSRCADCQPGPSRWPNYVSAAALCVFFPQPQKLLCTGAWLRDPARDQRDLHGHGPRSQRQVRAPLRPGPPSLLRSRGG